MSDKKNELLASVRNIAGTRELHESIITAAQVVKSVAVTRPKMSREVMEARKVAGLPLVEGIEDRQAEAYNAALEAIDRITDPAERQAQEQRLEQLNQVFSDAYEADDDEQMWGALSDMEDMAAALQPKLSESWDDDDDEDPDVKIAMKDKRQAAFEKKKAAADKEEEAKKAAAPKAEEKKEEPKSEEKPKAARGSFTTIARQMLAKGSSTADIRAALEKAGVSTAHLHSRLAGLRKSVKVAEGYVLTHPQMPSFVLAENPAMNQYQWISEKDDTTTLLPIIFETEAAAAKVKQYVYDYKNQLAVVTPISFGD